MVAKKNSPKKEKEDGKKNENTEEKIESEEKAPKQWKKQKNEDVEKIVLELSEKGETPSKIGLILRDTYGIPKAKLGGKKITKILKENKIKYTTEKEITEKRIEKLRTHVEKNKHDYTASRALTKQLWALKRAQSQKQ